MGPLLAHAGGVGSLLSLVVALSAGVAVVFVAVAVGRVPLGSGDDLVLPLASVAVVSSAAPLLGDLLSDVAAPAAPAGAVLLVALLLGAFTPLDLRRPPVALAAAVAAVLAAVLLGPPLAEGPWREVPEDPPQREAFRPAAAADAAARPPRPSGVHPRP